MKTIGKEIADSMRAFPMGRAQELPGADLPVAAGTIPEYATPPMQRAYLPPGNALYYDEDPGVMSEVETSSTGFRRGGKQRSSLPVVRTPSKTLERPLGLNVFRPHLRDIRDRSVLRLFEAKDLSGGVFPGALGVGSVRLPAAANSSASANLEDQSTYFSEPEIDEHIQHVHKAKKPTECFKLKRTNAIRRKKNKNQPKKFPKEVAASKLHKVDFSN
ncbi:unnamed protein product [Leptidea sinapis]|uniref:Uncharacterized protein n=1 Tax=Leptidea sinapis TaxID=189913 RepID=A0A5E4Q8V1_9NEOP|nr:unnamed protein product [Leptidea sinapis]